MRALVVVAALLCCDAAPMQQRLLKTYVDSDNPTPSVVRISKPGINLIEPQRSLALPVEVLEAVSVSPVPSPVLIQRLEAPPVAEEVVLLDEQGPAQRESSIPVPVPVLMKEVIVESPNYPFISAPEDPSISAPEDPSLSAPEDPSLSAPEDPSLSAPEDPSLSAPGKELSSDVLVNHEQSAPSSASLPVIIVVAPEPMEAPEPPMPSLAVPHVGGQFHAQDELKQYHFGHWGGPSTRVESRDALGRTHGSFAYVNPVGDVHVRKYAAAPVVGFKVAASDLPVDTPEVASLKAAHDQAHLAFRSFREEAV